MTKEQLEAHVKSLRSDVETYAKAYAEMRVNVHRCESALNDSWVRLQKAITDLANSVNESVTT